MLVGFLSGDEMSVKTCHIDDSKGYSVMSRTRECVILPQAEG